MIGYATVKSWLGVFLILGWNCLAIAQEPEVPQKYSLIVVRGMDVQNNIKKGRATKSVVEVRDRNNKPVAGIAIAFALPNSGPSGTFVNGSKFITMVTDANGQAAVTVQPNAVTGPFNMTATASTPGQPTTVTIPQTNIAGAAGVSSTAIGVIVGVAAAAGIGAALALRGGGSSPTAAATPPGFRIGAGAGGGITISPPH